VHRMEKLWDVQMVTWLLDLRSVDGLGFLLVQLMDGERETRWGCW
jgi:hypothetical protein